MRMPSYVVCAVGRQCGLGGMLNLSKQHGGVTS